MWAERPLSAANQDLAVLNVIHLKMLKRRLTEAMLTMFIDGCDVYVGLMRDASKNQVGHMKVRMSIHCCAYFKVGTIEVSIELLMTRWWCRIVPFNTCEMPLQMPEAHR